MNENIRYLDKLLNSDGRELRRSLFSLKQIFQVETKRFNNYFNEIFIFQDDKDLVHEFVNNQGLQCLVKIGGAADQNYQNYILRGREKYRFNQILIYSFF